MELLDDLSGRSIRPRPSTADQRRAFRGVYDMQQTPMPTSEPQGTSAPLTHRSTTGSGR
jgi:hypothetical protein